MSRLYLALWRRQHRTPLLVSPTQRPPSLITAVWVSCLVAYVALGVTLPLRPDPSTWAWVFSYMMAGIMALHQHMNRTLR